MVKNNKEWLFFTLVSSLVIILDQILKYLIVKYSFFFQWKFFSINLIQNTGAGFGILQGKNLWLGLLSLIVAILIIVYYNKIPKERVVQILFGLFLGGVIGNGIDRLIRGYVIDFIRVSLWPAFNLADASLTVAVIGLIVYSWKK